MTPDPEYVSFDSYEGRRTLALRYLDEIADRPWIEELRLYATLLLAEAAGRECGWPAQWFRPLTMGLIHSSARDNPWG